jgi:hypothetical protein
MNAITTISQDHDGQNDAGANRALTTQFQRLSQRTRQLGNNASKDDQRDTIADAARGDLLAEPHQEHRAADQRDDGRQAEEPARIGDDCARGFQANRNAVGLDRGQKHRAVAGVLVDDLAALPRPLSSAASSFGDTVVIS